MILNLTKQYPSARSFLDKVNHHPVDSSDKRILDELENINPDRDYIHVVADLSLFEKADALAMGDALVMGDDIVEVIAVIGKRSAGKSEVIDMIICAPPRERAGGVSFALNHDDRP